MPTRLKRVIRYNDRNYSPPEWEVWDRSEVIAHGPLDSCKVLYPDALVAGTSKH